MAEHLLHCFKTIDDGGQPPHLGDPIGTKLWWWCSSTAFAASHTCLICVWLFIDGVFLSPRPLCLPSSRHLLCPPPTGPGESAPIVIQPHATNSTSTPWAARRAVSGGPQSSNGVLKHVLIAGCIYHLSLSTSMLIMCINCGFLNAVVSSETHRNHQTHFFFSKKSHVNVIVPYTLTSFYEPSDLFDIMNPIYCFNFFFFCFIFKNKYWAGCGAAAMKPCRSKLWNNCIFTCTLISRSSCLRSGRCHEVWRHFDSRQLMVRSHCAQSSVAEKNCSMEQCGFPFLRNTL